MTKWMLVLLSGLLAACAVQPYGQSITYNDRNPNPIAVVMPASAPSITQQFRPPDDRIEDGATTDAHVGLDVHAARGTPVLAAASGRVTSSYFDPAYGNTIVLDHGVDENGAKVMTRYLHLSDRTKAKGDVVARGEQIGGMGASGFLAGGFLHLHFEVVTRSELEGIVARDPNLFWADGVGRVTCFDPDRAVPDLPFRTTYPVVCKGG